jgi:hypothetical protein
MSGSDDQSAQETKIMIDGHDYFDFGCSSGANISFNNGVFPDLHGLGIDIDARKIALARENGHQAVIFDILEIPDEKLVKFVTMSHFLEHLGCVADARQMIAKAISVSRDFVFIRQPWFDSDGDLFQLGYKFYWSHWKGHRNKMTALDFHSILVPELENGRIRRFELFGRGVVGHGKHPTLLPLGAPIDQHQYDEKLHGAKTAIELPFRAYREIVARIEIGDGSGADAIMERMKPVVSLYDSGHRT